MDSLTHALAGSLVADALPFTRKLGRRAQIAAVVAGMAPDLDLLPAFIANFPPRAFSFHGLLDMGIVMRYHRAYTHSFFYTAIAAIVLGLVIRGLFHARGHWWHWALLLWLAVVSHIVLDITNPWSVRCWLPFSDRREAWSLMPLMDPFFTGLLGLVFIVNHFLRDPYYNPDGGVPLAPAWRQRTMAAVNRLGGVSLLAWVATVLLVARVWLTGFGVFSYPAILS